MKDQKTMKLLKMPSGFQGCLLYSAAMLLDEDPEVLIHELGYDGQEKWWPELASPYCFRSHHIQEIQDLCEARDMLLAPIEIMPLIAPPGHEEDALPIYTNLEVRFLRMINNTPGIIIGQAPYSDVPHAVAWDGEMVHDPNGKIYTINEFRVREAWLLCHHIKI